MSLRICPLPGETGFRSVIAVLSVSLALALTGCSKPQAAAPEATAVNVVLLEKTSVPIYDEFVGQTDAPENVEIRVRVTGYVDKIAYTEGSFVKAGELLYQLDPRPFQAALASSKAQQASSRALLKKAQESVELVRAKAQLVAHEAALLNAQQNLRRIEPLASQRAVTQAQLDAASAQQKEAQAEVDSSRALVQQTELTQKTDIDAAKAALDAATAGVTNAELNLGYTTIHSPISGRIGRSSVKVGSLAEVAMANPLTIISTTDNIYVNFSATERQYLEFAEKLNEVERADRERTGQLEMILADGSVYPHMGRVNLTERSVNPETGTLGLRAIFPNPEGLVKPGQFAKIRTVIEMATDVIVVPAQAVQDLLGARFVYVVSDDNVVSRRDVVPGAQVGQLWVINKGLNPGDKVIVEGIQKVRPDAKVKATAVPMPSAQPAGAGDQAPAAT